MATGTVPFNQRCVDMFRLHLGTESGVAAKAKFSSSPWLEFELPFCPGNGRGKTERYSYQEQYNDCLSDLISVTFTPSQQCDMHRRILPQMEHALLV